MRIVDEVHGPFARGAHGQEGLRGFPACLHHQARGGIVFNGCNRQIKLSRQIPRFAEIERGGPACHLKLHRPGGNRFRRVQQNDLAKLISLMRIKVAQLSLKGVVKRNELSECG